MNHHINLVYSYEDIDKAEYIRFALEREGLQVLTNKYKTSYEYFYDYTSVYDNEPGGYVILLFSEHSNEKSIIKKEINEYLNMNFKHRNTTIIPVYLDKVKKEINEKQMISFNLYRNFEEGVLKLAKYIANSKFINFDNMTPQQFENLIFDLLSKMRFKVNRQMHTNDLAVDFFAQSRHNNPFGGSIYVDWIVQCKYFKRKSPELSDISKLIQLIETNNDCIENAVMFTNGILTSTSQKYLSAIREGINLVVVDGTQLKKLILKYPSIVEEHFSGRM